MKAIVYTSYGPPEVLSIQEIEKPIPGPTQVLIRVEAATVNRTDCALLLAKPFIMRFFSGFFNPNKTTPGTDFAGTVHAIGTQVTRFEVGDRVLGFDDSGLCSHAEFLTLSEEKAMVKIPEGIRFVQAAASAEGVHYAHNFINKIPLKKGQKVLVNGATGAIGSAVVQLLKHAGANVIAVCDTSNIDRVKGLGADVVLDYTQQDFTQIDIGTYDFVLDAVGKSSFRKCKQLLKVGGAYISSELGQGAENFFYALFTPFFSSKKVVFPIPSNIQASLDLASKLLATGELKPLIDRIYQPEEIAKAYTYVLSGQKIGNVLIDWNNNSMIADSTIDVG
ncbi:NAD(P)-dependent alcohol dehydrogenase [Arundinibacter roseus]|uniref:NAD(P)-dependent alcohol dehydrogenase n=1 Tax=Arundinibacter roseus TaxID=2070510 RepID=A0A4R4KJ84_9BACT|nr:NAD(P)-dependent alcohol dehydrogenase [Arundinibacter roseus]TDB66886.1 NAD(P)-dependent alcohol dehydrogenase [Arundinibacter roseus]